ncbi:DUF1127 domain-containing protein [Brevirhabdus sp.]|uniref:DUF1127 domain-containing protein n=1 Tax=Brevirhabdus sp. TaxID=2004514 RepID=UPI00405928CB
MAFATQTTTAAPGGNFFGIAATVVAAPFIWIARGLDKLATANRMSREINDLMQMSDQQLAVRGLKREDVPRVIFSRYGHL